MAESCSGHVCLLLKSKDNLVWLRSEDTQLTLSLRLLANSPAYYVQPSVLNSHNVVWATHPIWEEN